MEINNGVTSAAQSVTGTTNNQAAAVLSSDFETFLQMLTAQARFQDPLEPIDSSEYAAQLAQFSMVEQQVQTNDLLRVLGDQLGLSNIGQMASWIGMEARTTAPVQFTGEAISVFPTIDRTADEAVLIVYDSDGAEVQRQKIPVDASEFQWLGIDKTGSLVPDGTYRFSVQSSSTGRILGETPAETYATISEARSQNGSIEFVLSGGSVITAQDVGSLREPS